jgi:hypothetical protein
MARRGTAILCAYISGLEPNSRLRIGYREFSLLSFHWGGRSCCLSHVGTSYEHENGAHPIGGRKLKHASLEGCGDSKKFVHADSMSYGCNAVCSGII